MKKFVLILMLVISVIIFSGCTGQKQTLEKNTTIEKTTENTNKAPEKAAESSNLTANKIPENESIQSQEIKFSESKNLTGKTNDENLTANPLKENKTISKTSIVEVPLTKRFARYTDDVFGFSVDYPETWTPGDVGGCLGGKAFSSSSDPGSSGAAIITCVYSNESEAKFWVGNKEAFEEMKKIGRILKFEKVTINGREGTEVIYKSMFLPEGDTAQVCVVFDTEDYYYVFSAYAIQDYKSKYEKIIETSLNSFVIDENLKTK